MNCLESFHSEESRNKHFKYCKDNKTVRIEIPEKGSFVKFHYGQNQLKVPFVMYADFEAILKPAKCQVKRLTKKELYTKEINQHIPSGFCVYV